MFLYDAIKCWSEAAPLRAAVSPLNYRELKESVAGYSRTLPNLAGKRVGLYMGNRPLWGICDMALTLKGAVVVPIPTFFSKAQIAHIIQDAGIESVVCDEAGERLFRESFPAIRTLPADPTFEQTSKGHAIKELAGEEEPTDLSDPDAVAKIIYTSGTTGAPKGVQVTLRGIEAVTRSLVERTGTVMGDRHLSLLPLSTLVEAIGGLYRLLLAGASIVYPKTDFPPENILFRPAGLAGIVRDTSPTTLNLVPSLLDALVSEADGPQDLPSSLRFVACGGAPLLPTLRTHALDLGIPLFEGYGLSECSSVVALSGRGMQKEGSVGKPLPHAGVTISPEGEIIVTGPGIMGGYTNGTKKGLSALGTGDIGYIDDEGYLFVTGRRDNVILTAQGRNVSPEWVEQRLTSLGAVSQAFVYGDGNGRVAALVVPGEKWLEEVRRSGRAAETVLMELAAGEAAELPEYARPETVRIWERPFTIANGLLGPDGRIDRKKVMAEAAKIPAAQKCAAA